MRILLPTDFSQNSENAIRYALYVFESVPCSFYLLHAHQSAPSGLVSTMNRERDTRWHEITKEEAVAKLHKLTTHLRQINKVTEHSFEPICESDTLINAVGRNIVDQDIDYICMGTQGASGLKEVFVGSNTVKVLKNIDNCPILAVPGRRDFTKPSHIAFATDYRHLFETVEVLPLRSISLNWESHITIIHMSEVQPLSADQRAVQDHLKRLLEDIDLEFATLEYHPSVAVRIQEWVGHEKPDLLAMMNTRHGFLDKLLREPVIKKLAFKTPIPFLALPAV